MQEGRECPVLESKGNRVTATALQVPVRDDQPPSATKPAEKVEPVPVLRLESKAKINVNANSTGGGDTKEKRDHAALRPSMMMKLSGEGDSDSEIIDKATG
jgi:hypothetical protein